MALEIFPAQQQAPPQVPVPQHVAIIMDGNGRWAKSQYKPRLEGHRAGTERIRDVLSALGQRGVRYVTVYAFSTENWGRPEHEVNGLIELLQSVIHDEVPKLHEQNVRILHLGSRERFSPTLNDAIGDAVRLTAANTGLTLCVAFDYGGRAEIVEAVRRIVEKGTPAAAVTEEIIREHLSLPGVPDPDLIIRTAGEQRLSNFLIWQGAYAELYSTPTFWPDFDDAEVDKALEAYQQRQRRFGKLHGEG